MYQFNYHKASSVADAADLRGNAEDGVYLAGGMTLIPTLKQRLAAPSDVIDMGGLADLRGIAVGATVRIGALTTHAEVAASAEVRGAIPALSDLAEGIGDAHVRNRGTIGGSVANSDPAADYPAAVVGLGCYRAYEPALHRGRRLSSRTCSRRRSTKARSSLPSSSPYPPGRHTRSSPIPLRATPSSA